MSRKNNEPSSATLQSFIVGLSYQIPPSKLNTMIAGEGIQRLFLERSTEALPMGSTIRTAVGSNFEEALHLLQLEIEKRMKENEKQMGSSDIKRDNLQEKGAHKYALMAFSLESSQKYSPTDKKLKLCSDYASSTDFLQEKKDVLRSYKHALLYNRLDKTTSVDHLAFICAFLEQLPVDASEDVATLKTVERSIHEFVSCLVMDEILPASISLKVGELIGQYAIACFRLELYSSASGGLIDQKTNVNNAISMSIALLSSSVESISSFLTGYINCILEIVNDQPKSKSTNRVFVNTSTALCQALQCNNAGLNVPIPTVRKNMAKINAAATQFIDSKAQMTTLLKWASDYLPRHHPEENDGQSESDNDHGKGLGNESEVQDAETDEENVTTETLRRSTRKRKASA